MREIALIRIIVITATLISCTAPHQTFHKSTKQQGLTQTQLTTPLFNHKVFSNNYVVTNKVHIYFAGDGTPWVNGKYSAIDPTPRNSVALKLMAQEDIASFLIGRPCYHGLHTLPECHQSLWTDARYSKEIIESMHLALVELTKDFPAHTSLVLIGYSGGATLASLVAHVDQTHKQLNISKIISIAGNHDIDAWCDYHNVPRLAGSMNPMKLPQLPEEIKQVFYVGKEDKVVLPEHSVAYAEKQVNSRIVVVEGGDHVCCWVEGVEE